MASKKKPVARGAKDTRGKDQASVQKNPRQKATQNDKNASDLTQLVESLQQELEVATKKAEENWDECLRAKAEIENTRRRMERDIQGAHKYAVEKFIQDLIPVVDSLEMGLAAAAGEGADIERLKKGSELTLKMFTDTVGKFGVECIDPVGEPFNPEFHQAMSMQVTRNQKPNTVMAVMQKGYVLNGRLIRPAMVVVAKAESESKPKVDGTKSDTESVGTNIDEKA